MRHKKRTDKFWRTFDVGKILLNTIPQRLVLSQGYFGGAVMAKMIPDKFIRVQIWRIARKKIQFQFAPKRLYIGGNKPCFWGGQFGGLLELFYPITDVPC